MLEIGKYRISGYKERLLYAVCFVSSVYFLVNGLIPDLLGLDQFFVIPIYIEIPLYFAGILSLTVVGSLAVIVFVAVFDQRARDKEGVNYKRQDLIKLISKNSELLAPNISSNQRKLVVALIAEQLESGFVEKAHAVIDEGEESCQIAIFLTRSPTLVASAWEEVSDGVRILKTKFLNSKYNINSAIDGVEVVWD